MTTFIIALVSICIGALLFVFFCSDEKTTIYYVNCIEDAIEIFDQLDFQRVYECTIVYDYFTESGYLKLMIGGKLIELYIKSIPLLEQVYYQYRQYSTKNT